MKDNGHTLFAIVLATSLMMGSRSATLADDQTTPQPRSAAAPVPAKRPVLDVAMSTGDILQGRVVTTDGKPLDGARVIIRKDDRIAAALVTDSDGVFAVKGLTAGIYEMKTPRASGLFRCWRAADAPPSAKPRALLVSGGPIVRGQVGYGGPDLLSLGLGAAGVTVGVIALDKAEDAESRAERAERQVRDSNPVSP